MVGVVMKFCASRMYCKYVISLITNGLNKIRMINHDDSVLEDKLYNSYLELEKLLNEEFFG